MSNARQDAREAIASIDAAAWRQRIKQLTVPLRRYWPENVAEIVDANAASLAHAIMSDPSKFGFGDVRRTKAGYAVSAETLEKILQHTFYGGFLEAVLMHRRELLVAADAAAIVVGQRRGNDKGHQSQSLASEELAERIRRTWASMLKAGEKVTNDTVAAACKCSRSTVIRAFKSKAAKRKKR